MTATLTILLFTLNSLFRLDLLVWVVGLPLLVGAGFMLYTQVRQYETLKKEMGQLAKVKIHSVEYELVLKAMKLAIFHLDLTEQTFTVDTDYREAKDNLVFSPGTDFDEIVKQMLPEYVEVIRQGIKDLVDGRIDVLHEQFQMKVPHSDRTYWTEGYATVDKRDMDGRPLNLVGTLMRIDQQKEIETALMEAVYHAEESDRLKSAFLANISHEIRTPLNAIVGFSDVLPMASSEEERQSLIDLIKQNNASLLRIFDDMVSMSKLEARGGDAVKISTFSLKEVFVEMAEKYRTQADEKGLAILIADEENLPTLNSDRDRVREIINQYMNNALKFTASGQVTLGCMERNDKLRIYVKDTGKGISKENCNDSLFERFVKVDEFIPGTGLGLSICRSLALSLDGTVGVESEYGEGSVFWVELNR